MNKNMYIIYESAITSPAINPVRNGNIVEFITVLQEAGRKNRNGRIYPKEVIDGGIHSPLVQEHLKHHTLIGEAGHPFSQEVARQTNVDLRNACFRVDELWWEGNLLKGRCRTLDTAAGRDMAGMILDGCELSFSMRGQGQVVRDPINDALVVQPPLMIICWDWVWTPSHDVAYMEKICEETKGSFFRNDAMALTESMNLYESGSMFELNPSQVVEKPTLDFFATYGLKYKSLDEMYVYDPNDKVVEINEAFVLLENDTCKKKVAKADYLLKSVRYAVSESFIAATDNPRSIIPLEDKDQVQPEIKAEDVLSTKEESADVGCTETIKEEVEETVVEKEMENMPEVLSDVVNPEDKEYKNPVEAEVSKELGDDAINVSEEEGSLDKKDPNADRKTALKEEFYKYYNLIAEETGLTEEADIIRTGVKYAEYMSEDCAFLFKTLNEGEDK